MSYGRVCPSLLACLLQDVAERIEREAKARHYAPRMVAMDAYDVKQLPHERAVVFVASTTGQVNFRKNGFAKFMLIVSLGWLLGDAIAVNGLVMVSVLCMQGDVPDNMKRFWRFLLNRNLPPNSLSQLQSAVFGLGDSGATGSCCHMPQSGQTSGTQTILKTLLAAVSAADAACPHRRVRQVQCGGQEAGATGGGAGGGQPGGARPGRRPPPHRLRGRAGPLAATTVARAALPLSPAQWHHRGVWTFFCQKWSHVGLVCLHEFCNVQTSSGIFGSSQKRSWR